MHRNQLYAWRREFRRIERASKAGSVPAVAPDGGSAVRRGIEISFGGAVIRVGDEVDPAVLSKILHTLKRLG